MKVLSQLLEADLNVYRREVARHAGDLRGQVHGASPAPSQSAAQPGLQLSGLNVSSGSSIEQERLNVEKERLVQEKRLALESAKSSCEVITQDLSDLTTEFTENFI